MGMSGSLPQTSLLLDLERIPHNQCDEGCEHYTDHVGMHMFGHINLVLKTYHHLLREEWRKRNSPNEPEPLVYDEYNPPARYVRLFNMAMDFGSRPNHRHESTQTLSASWVSFLERLCRFEHLVANWRSIVGLTLPHILDPGTDWDEPKPINAETLTQIVNSALDELGPANSPTAEDTDPDCPICFDPYNTADRHRVSTKKCNHSMCMSCVTEWTTGENENANKCPFCRRELFPRRLTPRQETLAQIATESDGAFRASLLPLVRDADTRRRIAAWKGCFAPFMEEMGTNMWDFAYILAGFEITFRNDDDDGRVAIVAARMQAMLDHVDHLVAGFLGRRELAERYRERSHEWAKIARLDSIEEILRGEGGE
ncbi:uncharacterized protein BDZ99DRAFT_480224 [Mytilinidion resinicola]|uniref:RING-type domain-containing protein n=1 Tax=Mytilinidion resinicola TaxID=574789 RepID=A0A6A6Y9L1_9PEZI|nr:uncharacterized protein BDZ99DRAFT_480224 [Mytilinidion resinicola]KAF2805512.1 hypothetical protein BDZ99DRAFT_480224 [Mytilinidion resinicola]